MSVKIIGDYSEIDREFDRLDHMPDEKAAKLLGFVLDVGFADTQAAVHVETGSLKSSGKTDTGVTGHNWHGEITYGGPSAGIHNPVDYAIYEKRRRGPHDFFGNLQLLDSLFATAMKEGLAP